MRVIRGLRATRSTCRDYKPICFQGRANIPRRRFEAGERPSTKGTQGFSDALFEQRPIIKGWSELPLSPGFCKKGIAVEVTSNMRKEISLRKRETIALASIRQRM